MNRPVKIIILALGAQSFQSSIIFITLAWYFINKTHSPLVFSSLMAFRYIPGILLTMLSGVAIDRMKKIPLGFWSSVWHLFSLCLLLAIGLLEIQPSGSGYWLYCGILLFLGVSSAVLTPLERTLIPMLTSAGNLKSVNSIITAVSQITNLLGTSIAGALLLFGGFPLAMGTAIAMSVISVFSYLVLMSSVSLPEQEKEKNGIKGALKQTIGSLGEQRWIFTAIFSAVFTNMAFVMIMDVELPVIYADAKVNGSAALGICFTAIGAGTLAGAALTYRMKRITFDIAIVLYILSGMAGTLGGYLADSAMVSILLFGLFGLLAAPITIIFQTEIQEIIPLNILGSAMGFLTAGATIAQPVGVFIAGLLLLKLSVSTALALSCGFSILAVALGWIRIKQQKRLMVKRPVLENDQPAVH